MPAPALSLKVEPVLPWYRHRWPWLLIAGPALVVIAGLVTAWLAIMSADGLVADDYYKRGLLINRELAHEAAGAALGLGAIVTVDPAGTSVQVVLTANTLEPLPAGPLRLKLAHPTRAGLDRMFVLDAVGDRRYAGKVSGVAGGRWLVSIESDSWRLPMVETVVGAAELRLGQARQVR